MNDAIKFTEGLQKKLSKNTTVTIVTILASLFTVIIAVAIAVSAVKSTYGKVYVMSDNGSIDTATRKDRASVVDKEIRSHVQIFHEYMYNLTPDTELIYSQKESVLALGDKSAFEAWNKRDSDHFYSRLVNTGTIEQIKVDSIQVNINRYPYFVRTFAKVYLLRKDTTTQYDFVSECNIINTQRSDTNLHGMIIEHFEVKAFNKIQTRRRQ